MRFQLTLIPNKKRNILPANYKYPLSAAIYKILHQADEKYSSFLHDHGYQLRNGKSFKLFSFSDLKVPYHHEGDRLLINGVPSSLTISFHADEAASNFIKGLFINQQVEIADKISGAKFHINEVQLLPDLLASVNGDEAEVVLQPLSPLVVGRKNAKGNYDFLRPGDADFIEWLVHNWIEKFKAVNINNEVDAELLKKKINIKVVTPLQEIKSRLITIKAFTPQETKIRGFTRFDMNVTAPKHLLELALNAGMGLYNAMGMGCVGVVKIIL